MSTQTKSKTAGSPTDRLPPTLPATPRRETARITSFGGLDMGCPRPWSIAEMRNLSPRCAPAMATRRPREMLDFLGVDGAAHGIAMMEGTLYFVQGSTLYRITQALTSERSAVETVGSVTDTDKSMTVFGGRLLIFPDKMYVDAADGVLRPMELNLGIMEQVEFKQNQITLPRGVSWQNKGFHPGDSVYIRNEDSVYPAPEGYYRIKELNGRYATVMTTFTSTITADARILRFVPDLTATAACGNRLFGYNGKDIYICAEGESLGWQGTQTDGRGPLTLHTSTEGEITACAQWQGYMVFFKPSRICRVLGSGTGSYALAETAAPGIPAAMSRTLCEVDGDLYYHGNAGVYRYSSATQRPECVGRLGQTRPVGGCGGTGGGAYYLDLVTEEGGVRQPLRYLYIPESDAWYAEDGIDAAANVSIGGCLCTQDHAGRLWISRPDGRLQGFPIREEHINGMLPAYAIFSADYTREPDGYRPIALYLRATAEANASLRVVASFADGRVGRDAECPVWDAEQNGFAADSDRVTELAAFTGPMNDRLLRVPLPCAHCDHMILALEMHGGWKIAALMTEYEVVRR